MIANTDFQHRAKMDIALFGPLLKFQFLQELDESTFAAEITNEGFFFGGQLPVQWDWRRKVSLHGVVSACAGYFTRASLAWQPRSLHYPFGSPT